MKRIVSVITILLLLISTFFVSAEGNPRYVAKGSVEAGKYKLEIMLKDIDATLAGIGLSYDAGVLLLDRVELEGKIKKVPLLELPDNQSGYYISGWYANSEISGLILDGTKIMTFYFDFKAGKTAADVTPASFSVKPWINILEFDIINDELWNHTTEKYVAHSYNETEVILVDLGFEIEISDYYSITASAGTGGIISSSGISYVAAGASKDYNIDAGPSYNISRVIVNGSDIGIANGLKSYVYRFSDVQSNQTITVEFAYVGGGGSTAPTTPGGPRPPYYLETPPPPPPLPKLELEQHYRYVLGYPDGTVRPENNISREEVAAIFYRLLDSASRKQYRRDFVDFPDIEPDRWSLINIGTMQNAKIVEGYADGAFRPEQTITRAEFATIAARFDNLSDDLTHNFSDVTGHWAEKYIASAAQKGWIVGYDDRTFAPDRAISRAEAMTLINRVLLRKVDSDGLLAELVIDWPDLPVSHWGYYDVQEATISHNYDRRFPEEFESDKSNLIENWTSAGEDVNFDLD